MRKTSQRGRVVEGGESGIEDGVEIREKLRNGLRTKNIGRSARKSHIHGSGTRFIICYGFLIKCLFTGVRGSNPLNTRCTFSIASRSNPI